VSRQIRGRYLSTGLGMISTKLQERGGLPFQDANPVVFHRGGRAGQGEAIGAFSSAGARLSYDAVEFAATAIRHGNPVCIAPALAVSAADAGRVRLKAMTTQKSG
jgi:hypothetical protein